MAKVRDFSLKASKARNRVRKHREKKKLQKFYENQIRVEIERRERLELVNDNSDSDIIFNEQAIYSTGEFNTRENLQKWKVKHHVKGLAINDLLPILISAGIRKLPRDSRTLMKTPKNVEYLQLSSGQLWYGGLRKGLEVVFQNLKFSSNDPTEICLDFNFDGVPLFNSSTLCFWPILAAIRGGHKYY